MKNKYDILMYVAAILGGVLGAYLCAKRNGLGGGYCYNMYYVYYRSYSNVMGRSKG